MTISPGASAKTGVERECRPSLGARSSDHS
jgi:hypothetical protein